MQTFGDRFDSPVGPLGIVVDDAGRLRRLSFLAKRTVEAFAAETPGLEWSPEPCAAVRSQVLEYFEKERRDFDLELAFDGPEFEQRVWRELLRIPYASTISYGELARRIENPEAAQAVGQANHKNPIAIVIPCHRVTAASGELIGFGGGVATQRALLDLERGQRTFF